MALKTSINIKYDLGDKKLIDDYFATSSHSEIIKGVLSSAIKGNTSRAHIAYGPYGSGKSYVSTILANLIANKYPKTVVTKLNKKYKSIDSSFSAILEKSQELDFDYIPVVLNGFNGSFEESIITAIQDELLKRKIYIATPGIFNEIGKIVKRWKSEYALAYNQFEELISQEGYTIKDFNRLLKNNDERIVKVFTEIFETITFGSQISFSPNSKLVEYLEFVLIELQKKNIGLFIVYDEFGRILQNVDSENLNQFMGMLQDVAELATSGAKNLITLFVAHKPISYYFSLESREMRSEFAKVEKRFSVYEIKSDYTTFLKITQDFLSDYDEVDINPTIGYNMRKFNVFANELSDSEVDNIVLKSLYPLHPITLYLLPNISKVFGQNERTLFTFLKDESSSGLTGFAQENDSYYYPDRLADYFFEKIDESYIENVKVYKIYRNNIKDIRALTKGHKTVDSLRVFKFIMLWSITANSSGVQLTDEFISFALGIELKQTKKILSKLSIVKKIRYNLILSEWEIFEGSPIDVKLEVQKRLANLVIHNNKIIEFLSLNNPYRYVYSKTFNTNHEMTRFGEIEFLLSETELEDKKQSTPCDQFIPVFFNQAQFSLENIPYLYGVIEFDLTKLEDITRRLIILNQMLKDTTYIRDNPNVDKEIEYEITLIEIELSKFYNKLFLKDTTYYVSGTIKKIRSLDMLESVLSNHFTNQFDSTLHIVNDQVNMFELTKIQTNALISVLDKVIKLDENQLGDYFSGSKPTDLIYYTLIRDLYEVNGNRVKLNRMRETLQNYIVNNPDGKLYSVIELLQKEPFGLRPQVSILLAFYMTKDLWKDIMLFSNDSFIPSIETEDLFFALLNDTDRIRYSFNIFDNENRDVLENLETVFNEIPLEVESKSLSIRVCAGMYNWYLNLPIITQQLDGLSPSDMEFMRIIASSRINPRKAILDLLERQFIYNIDSFVNSIEANFDNKISIIERRILNKVNSSSLGKWALAQNEISKKNNKFVSLCINCETPMLDYAKYVENLEIKRWTKSSFEKMELMIKEDINLLNEDVDFSSIVINGKEKLVQNVSLSRKTENALESVVNTIDATRRFYSDAELEQLVIELVKKYIK